MDFASPAVELLGFCVRFLAIAGGLTAALIFLRGKGTGPWIMLTGSVFSLLGMIPSGVEQFVNHSSSRGYEPPDVSGLMYYTFWNWLPDAAGLLFAAGLVITALQRRGLAKRIAELESILSSRQSDSQR